MVVDSGRLGDLRKAVESVEMTRGDSQGVYFCFGVLGHGELSYMFFSECLVLGTEFLKVAC